MTHWLLAAVWKRSKLNKIETHSIQKGLKYRGAKICHIKDRTPTWIIPFAGINQFEQIARLDADILWTMHNVQVPVFPVKSFLSSYENYYDTRGICSNNLNPLLQFMPRLSLLRWSFSVVCSFLLLFNLFLCISSSIRRDLTCALHKEHKEKEWRLKENKKREERMRREAQTLRLNQKDWMNQPKQGYLMRARR